MRLVQGSIDFETNYTFLDNLFYSFGTFQIQNCSISMSHIPQCFMDMCAFLIIDQMKSCFTGNRINNNNNKDFILRIGFLELLVNRHYLPSPLHLTTPSLRNNWNCET